MKSLKWARRRKKYVSKQLSFGWLFAGTLRRRLFCGKDRVWVAAETIDPDGDLIEHPKRMKRKLASPEKIIRCACGLPAKRVDQYWPYHEEMNRCAGCLEKERRKR